MFGEVGPSVGLPVESIDAFARQLILNDLFYSRGRQDLLEQQVTNRHSTYLSTGATDLMGPKESCCACVLIMYL